MPLSLHAATNRWGSGEAFQLRDTARITHLCNMDMGFRMSLADIIYSGVFERYPKLQVGAVEHELSWAPHFLGFQKYALGIRLRDIIGVDTLQWGSDYPHHESTFPRSREILEDILSECTEEEKAKIAGGNAARVYNI